MDPHNKVMLCFPDESSRSLDRIYAALEERALEKMLRV